MKDHLVSGEILLYALRYCLGRNTYAEEDGLAAVRDAYPSMKPSLREAVRRDIAEHITYTERPGFPGALHGKCSAKDTLRTFEAYEQAQQE